MHKVWWFLLGVFYRHYLIDFVLLLGRGNIRNILNKLEEVERLINDLPEYTVAEEEYDEDVRAFPMHKRYAKDELENLMEEIKLLLKYA